MFLWIKTQETEGFQGRGLHIQIQQMMVIKTLKVPNVKLRQCCYLQKKSPFFRKKILRFETERNNL